jgi:hypothetical protein
MVVVNSILEKNKILLLRQPIVRIPGYGKTIFVGEVNIIL